MSIKKNVLFAHNVAEIGGAEKVTLSIVQGLQNSENGSVPYLISPVDGPLIAEANQLGANATPLRLSDPALRAPLKFLIDTVRCVRFLKRNEIKFVHTGDVFITRKLLLAVKLLKLKLVCHIHFPVTLSTLRWVFFFQPSSVLFLYCSHELCVEVSQLASQVVPDAQHIVIHNGVDTELFQPNAVNTKCTDRTFHVGMVANLQERKGHDDLIEAAKILKEQGRRFLFHIIGGDVFGESRELILKNKVKSLDLVDSFCFHGQVTDVQSKLAELDMYVCCSHVEAFPISLLEAMAHQLPIVSTNVNGIPEMLIDGRNGLLVDRRSPQQLARALSVMMDDEVFRVRLAKNARDTAVTRFSIDAFRKKCYAIYES